jgi:N-glycosylase/DNA lyase
MTPPRLLTVQDLQEDYLLKRESIRVRLKEFEQRFHAGDQDIFKELCFCILAANSSAEMGLKTLAAMEDILLHADLGVLQDRIRIGFRFKRKRPSYIVHTREYLKREFQFKLRELLGSFPNAESRRAFFAQNRDIKGIGMKEASHFLRNVGFRGYAILDIHILKCLRELGVIRKSRKALTPDRYRNIENKMREFSAQIGIDMDELDLLLWSRKTGKILK